MKKNKPKKQEIKKIGGHYATVTVFEDGTTQTEVIFQRENKEAIFIRHNSLTNTYKVNIPPDITKKEKNEIDKIIKTLLKK